MGTRLLLVALLSATMTVLTGCASDTETLPAATPVTGLTLGQVAAVTPLNTLTLYDLSTPVLDQMPTILSAEPESFVVISACGRTVDEVTKMDKAPLGVIPAVQLTNEIATAAVAGEYDDLMPSCDPQ